MKDVKSSDRKSSKERLACCAAGCVVAGMVNGVASASTPLQQHTYASPLGFERNEGQTDRRVDFMTRGQGYALFLTSSEMILSLKARTEGSPSKLKAEAKTPATVADVVRMQLRGGAKKVEPEGVDLLPGKVNYLTGSDKKQWRTNVSTYKAVKYAGVYPGVDVVYYGKGRELEYDFVVAPGADPKAIELTFSGAKVDVDAKGDLVLAAAGGDVRLHKPVLYQLDGDRRVEVAGNYVRQGSHGVKFEVGAYDRARPLVIDPILSYSMYLGGSGRDSGEGIAVDPNGDAIYVTGSTSSPDFPGQRSDKQEHDVFITKLSGDGSKLIYSTFIGGSGGEVGNDIAVNGAGETYVAGSTGSEDFPLVKPIQPASTGIGDGFVLKLSSDGSSIVYSTFLGGSRDDEAASIDIDRSGAAYVTGRSFSTDFPVVNAFQPKAVDALNAFLTKISPAGDAFVFSTYLGGHGRDEGAGVAIDQDGSAYVTGLTRAEDFPTVNPLQPKLSHVADAFITKFAADGASLVYSTYLGGGGVDTANAIAVDAQGAAYVVGETAASDFPTARAFQPAIAGGYDAFLAKLTPTGNALDFSTFLGGGHLDRATDVVVDASGRSRVVGETQSIDFRYVSRYRKPQVRATDLLRVSSQTGRASSIPRIWQAAVPRLQRRRPWTFRVTHMSPVGPSPRISRQCSRCGRVERALKPSLPS